MASAPRGLAGRAACALSSIVAFARMVCHEWCGVNSGCDRAKNDRSPSAMPGLHGEMWEGWSRPAARAQRAAEQRTEFMKWHTPTTNDSGRNGGWEDGRMVEQRGCDESKDGIRTGV